MPIDEFGWGLMGWGGEITSGGGGGGGGGGGTGPSVENFQPAEGQPITPSTPLEFDVIFNEDTDAPLAAIVVSVLYKATGAIETVYDREGFSVNFRPQGNFLGSTRTSLPNGWHFKLRRRSGWFATPTVKVQGADTAGNAIEQDEI
jgi:hypothetical protein